MSIVKGLISLLGGEIHLKSEVGKGSEFSFYIPNEKGKINHNKILTKKSTEAKILTGKTVLIVEDDLNNMEFLKEVLTTENLTIIHTESGKTAIKMALQPHIDLVLMDIRLPDINGYEATKKILSRRPLMKIIAQTAYATQEEKQKALDSGCIDYISKPIKKDILLSLIRQYL